MLGVNKGEGENTVTLPTEIGYLVVTISIVTGVWEPGSSGKANLLCIGALLRIYMQIS